MSRDDGSFPLPPEPPDDGPPEVVPTLDDRLALDELRKLRARDRARRLFEAERGPTRKPGDFGFLDEILARPAEPPARVESLIPWESSTLLSAIRKAGKTTLTLNLAHSMLTGQDFLRRFGVRKLGGIVGMLNFEVTGSMLAGWAAAIGVPRRGLWIENLRGKTNPLSDPELRGELVDRLRRAGVEALIVDPFGVAYTGTDQNDNGAVRAYLNDLDRLAREEVGAKELILTAHAGWVAEHARGASALEDWPDAVLTLTRTEPGQERYLRAISRLDDLDEDRLGFDPHTRRLYLTGAGSRSQAKDSDTRQAIIAKLSEDDHLPGLNGRELADACGRKDGDFTKARDALVADGILSVGKRPGRGGGFIYTLASPEDAEHAETYRPAPSELTEPLPYREVRSSVGTKADKANMPNRCTRCHEPMVDLGDGATTHPIC